MREQIEKEHTKRILRNEMIYRGEAESFLLYMETIFKYYNVPPCQDHLKKILIPPTYDTLSNIFVASNS